MNRKISQSEVVRACTINTKRQGSIAKGRTANKIISAYIEKVILVVLQGQRWQFPSGEEIYIRCKAVAPEQLKTTVYRKKGYKRNFKFDFSRLGLEYEIVFTGGEFEKGQHVFQSAESFRKKLYRVLTKTNMQYIQE